MRNYTDGYTRTCGLIGNPVKHTLSPLIHNALAQIKGINLVYVPFEVQGSEIQDAIKGARALGLLGLNVTIPHKSAVIPYLEDIDPLAKGIGAVNTLVRTGEGGFKGYNTDMSGLYRAISEEGVDFKDQIVVILGAGGVARPAAFLSADKGARKVYILNRTYEKAQAVAEEVNKAVYEMNQDDKCTEDGISARGEASSYDEIIVPMKLEQYKELCEREDKFIVLQCTSVGLFPDVNSAVIEDPEFYKHVIAAMDMVYRPVDTKFLKLARAAGAKTVSGLKMLLYQGIDAFELWNQTGENDFKISREEADEVYRSLLLEVIGARNIILEGFMGCGKTTVSEILADKLELELIDTDEVIVDTEKRNVNEIFASDGEQYFRDLETELIRTVVNDHWTETVISLGGGLPIREENRLLLKQAGKVVYLRTRPETVFDRIKDDTTRPLLQTKDPLVRIKELQDERREIYEQAADIVIDTDKLSPEEIADRIITELGL